jgi:hypothetical protein
MVVAGQYELQELLGEDERGAFYRASVHGSRAVVQVMQGQHVEFWRRAAELDHPNLQRVLDSGTEQGMTYVVFEYPDDRLAGAVDQLKRDEAHEVVAALRSVLSYLHQRGFAHTAVTADHIVAMGDTIKLESDTLRDVTPAAETADWRQWKELASEMGVSEDAWGGLSRRPWLIAAAAVVAVVALVVLMRHSTTQASRPPTYVAPVANVSPAPVVRAPAPAPHAEGSWRVIAYTYTRYQDAAHKAGTINRKFPDLQAEVFSPGGRGHGPFLVSLGGRVTRSEAGRLERKAKSLGLPRDTFARNYTK